MSFPEYPAARTLRTNLRLIRASRQLTCADAAKIVESETGYHFTEKQYEACESGVTKGVPVWVPLALMSALEIDPREMFT